MQEQRQQPKQPHKAVDNTVSCFLSWAHHANRQYFQRQSADIQYVINMDLKLKKNFGVNKKGQIVN